MNISGIYQIQSKLKPERIYIGSAMNIHNRWGVHLCDLRKNQHANKKLQNHFNKYGESDLQFSILLGCEKEYLIVNEQFFIDSYKPFFNIRIKADSNLGVKYSEEVCKKMGALAKGRPSPNKGKKASEETRKKQSEAKKGKYDGKKNPFYGKQHTKESMLKSSVSHMGQGSWNKGIIRSSETRKKISESRKGKRAGENHPMFGKHHNPEVRKKISENSGSRGKSPWNKGKTYSHLGKYKERA